MRIISDRISEQVSKMTALMDDVLILGQLTSGNVPFHPKELDLVEFCNLTIDQFNLIQKDGRKLDFAVKGKPYNVELDDKLLTHSLNNLISNAFKYSVRKQNPQLSIYFKPTEVILSVKDYGLGVSVEEQLNLFEPFFRSENVERIQGTGLGLSIAKEYVEVNKGQITAKSVLGEGSCFEITFKQ